jgi:murein DD-endopeptidase MepM/ murein hydrolase activator NlpD/Zn-dependent protease with chaperone function
MAGEVLDLLAAWCGLLLQQSVYAAVVFGGVFALTRFLLRRGPLLHLALWSLVFVRLVLPPALSQPFGLGAVLERLSGAWTAAPAVSGPRGSEVGLASNVPASGALTVNDAAPAAWRSVLGAAWLAGFVFAAAAHARRRAGVWRILAAARPVVDPLVLDLADGWRRRLRVRRRVRVVMSGDAVTPFTAGVLRPRIYLPEAVTAKRRCLEPVIAHEMAHVAQWDSLWLELQHLLRVVYFFHPLVWISGAWINEARERLCDARVLDAGRIGPRDYAGSLLDVLRLDLEAAGAPTMTARSRRIAVRISDILEHQRGHRPRVAAALGVTCAAAAFLLPLAGSAAAPIIENPVAAAPAVDAAAPAIELDNPVPDGRITWGWGHGRDPFSSKEVFHRGVDVAAAAGTPVRAPAAGIVTVATESYEGSPASGTVLVIDHGDGLATQYSHLGTLDVREGEKVARGQVIAGIGSTGRSTGPHVHFEVHRDGEPVDPAEHVKEWTERSAR